jgi:hypothetical protein
MAPAAHAGAMKNSSDYCRRFPTLQAKESGQVPTSVARKGFNHTEIAILAGLNIFQGAQT